MSKNLTILYISSNNLRGFLTKDRAFEEKHEYVKNFTEELEKERNWRRNLLSENERLLQRVRYLEDEIRSNGAVGPYTKNSPDTFHTFANTEFPNTVSLK